MGTHNQNGRNVSQTDENRPSWRAQDQQPDDDRERQGQSGYGGGRYSEDRSLGTQGRSQNYREDREQGSTGVDDRFDRDRGHNPERQGAQGVQGGRGFEERDERGFEDRSFDDRGRGDHRGRGDDRGRGDERSDYCSGYDQGMGYGGYGGNLPAFRGGSMGAQNSDETGRGRDMYGQRHEGSQWGQGHQGRMDQNRGGPSGGGPYGGGQGGGRQLGQPGGGQRSQYSGSQLGAPSSSGFDGSQTPRGPHRGKGPQGYTRSDDRIKESVCEALTDDHDIDATHIEVVVKNGEVILTGMVDDRRTKRHAEDVVEQLPGVKDVQNQLRVGDRTDRGNQGAGSAVGKNETESPAPGNDKKNRA